MRQRGNRGKYKEAVFYTPQYKMGVKVLSRVQLDNIFPSYDNLMKRIEQHRGHVGIYGRYQGNLDGQYNLMFDNVFSIMGRRGSGKTSVVYTLKKMFEDIKETDVVLPIIMSELIPESCEIIGWILSLLEDTVRDIHAKLSEKAGSKGMFKDCKVKSEYSIQEKYDIIKELCFSKSYDVASEGSFSRAVANSERRTQNSFDFSHKLAEFWADLREGIREANDMGPDEEPLVYIIFDDVDLAPEKVWELLSTIVKYLSFPNVVVLVTADEEMLYEVVKNILYVKVSNGELAQELVASPSWFREMAKLYVDKILPPSTRYYIENFESCARKSTFVAQMEFSEEGEEIRQIRLKGFLEKQIADYLAFLGQERPEGDFLHYKNRFLDVYLLFWGDTSRQLGNECLIVEQLIGNLKDLHNKYLPRRKEKADFKEDFYQDIYHIIYYFVFSTLNANSNAVLSSQEIKALADEMVLFQPGDWGVYFNYRYLYDRFDQRFRNGGNLQYSGPFNEAGGEDAASELLRCMKESVMLYLLLFFLENLLIEAEEQFAEHWGKKRDRVHGFHSIVALLDLFTPQDYSLVRCDGDSHRLREFLYEYGGILEKPELLNQFHLLKEFRVRKYFDALPEDSEAEEGAYHYYINNPNWFRTMVKAVYLQKAGVYGVNRIMLTGLGIDSIKRLHDRGIEYLDQEEIDCICTYLEDPENFGDEKQLIRELFKRPDSDISLGEGWKSEETITDITAYVEKQVPSGLDVVANIRAYYFLLRSLSDLKYHRIFLRTVKEGISKGINEVTSEIMNIMNCFTVYQVENAEKLEEYIDDVEILTSIRVNRRIMKEPGKGVDIKYINSLLRTVLNSLSEESESDWYGHKAQLTECYTKLKAQFRVDISEENKEKALELVLLRKVRMYMKCMELSLYFRNFRNQEVPGSETRLPAKTRIPYDRFYDDILALSKKRMEEQRKTKDGTIIFLGELIKGYIREGVRQYVDNLLGDNT